MATNEAARQAAIKALTDIENEFSGYESADHRLQEGIAEAMSDYMCGVIADGLHGYDEAALAEVLARMQKRQRVVSDALAVLSAIECGFDWPFKAAAA
jgi:N-acetylglucosamine-6-phosphate deacetylase